MIDMLQDIEPSHGSHPGYDSGIELCRRGLADRIGHPINGGWGCDYTGTRPLLAVQTVSPTEPDVIIASWHPEYSDSVSGWYCVQSQELLF